ncbi:PREDICTED: protein cab-1 [Papilio polytes]|uniref:protein cab-1 n=1 Tax=Papilio polytes TaxID=76194 RepID=UPI000675C904|nr:PREDICTED: protein cab-1 [Papilio polytes]
MLAIRILVVVLTAWNIAEKNVKGAEPPGNQIPYIKKLRALLTESEVPTVVDGKPTTKTVVYKIPEIEDWLEKMLRNSKRSTDFSDITERPFAYSPETTSYYYVEENPFHVAQPKVETKTIQDQTDKMIMPRKTRQEQAGEDKEALVADELDDLASGLDSTARPRLTFFYDTNASDLSDSIYSIGILIGVIAAITVSLVGLTYGLYVLSKKIKATGEPEYPAYGVTGPSDVHGDSRLAHSAHLYHYQHQKQQIIAMEKGVVAENRPGSVSEPESEENEEGDYTVYECPGFATTGDMEVKNPMFSDEPTPATPGKCEIVRPQPKE